MNFSELKIPGAYRITLEKKEDERGFFARQYCEREFADHGLNTNWVQMNLSHSVQKGTLRGMHFQRPPDAEVKMVKCVSGQIFDVMVDLRRGSDTFGQWYGEELSAQNHRMFYIPKGVAHGFQVCSDGCEMIYWHSEFYEPNSEGGINPLDESIGINWPLGITEISNRDKKLPRLEDLDPITI